MFFIQGHAFVQFSVVFFLFQPIDLAKKISITYNINTIKINKKLSNFIIFLLFKYLIFYTIIEIFFYLSNFYSNVKEIIQPLVVKLLIVSVYIVESFESKFSKPYDSLIWGENLKYSR